MSDALTTELRNNLIDAIMAVPSIGRTSTREALLADLPPNLVSNLEVEGMARVVVTNIVTILERVGRLTATGMRPLVVIARAASRGLDGTEAGHRLASVIKLLEAHYGGAAPAPAPPSLGQPVASKVVTMPEAIILGDDRVDYPFLEGALRTARSVARLKVPRIFDGKPDGTSLLGTGWLIAPGLLITNHHVIDARDRDHGEVAASEADLRAQGRAAGVWFDYRLESGDHVEFAAAKLVCWSPVEELDYALVRLVDGPADRKRLPVVPKLPPLVKGARLNIVQHPQGGPLRFGIRGNAYVGTGDEPHFLRYLTDTAPGASGSPVLNDAWIVVGLHHASKKVQQQQDGQPVYLNNEGIAIDAVVRSLPDAVRKEVEAAQGW